MRRSQAKAHSLCSGQPLPTVTKSRRTCAQQEDQDHVPQSHLGHRLVRRVAVDHQHHAGVGREVALGHFVAPGRIQAKDHRVRAQENPQPPAMPRLAFEVDEDHPAGLVRLGERRLSVACQQGVVSGLKQRFEAFQSAGHGPRRHVQTEQPPLGKQPLRGPVAGELVEEDFDPDRHARRPLGDQLGRGRSGDGPRAARAVARPSITPSPDAATIGADVDLDLLGVFRVAGRQLGPALRAGPLVVGQLAKDLNDRQVCVIPSLRAGPVGSLATLGRPGGGLFVVVAVEAIGAVAGQILLALSPEELVPERAILAPELFDLGFEFPLAIDRPRVHRLPIPNLLAEVLPHF